jgi:ribosome-associated protein YbcJ (S4-like RNA binding protein)
VFTPFQLDANLVLDPIIYLGGLLKVVDADTDSKGARLKMYITENLSDLMIDGSCRVS